MLVVMTDFMVLFIMNILRKYALGKYNQPGKNLGDKVHYYHETE